MTQEVTSPIRTDFLDNWPSKTPEELSDIFRAISNSHQHPARFRPNPKDTIPDLQILRAVIKLIRLFATPSSIHPPKE